jgi:hypothetical protein
VDIVVLIENNDGSAMQAALSCGAMDLLLQMLTPNDHNDNYNPLLKMSQLDLIKKIAVMTQAAPHNHERARWLLSSGVLQPILQMAGAEENSKPDPILGGLAGRIIEALCKLELQHRDLEAARGENDDDRLLLFSGLDCALHNFVESSGGGELD